MSGAYNATQVAEQFAVVLKSVRDGADQSQAKLSSKSGVSKNAIQLYEKGKRQPTLSRLINLAEGLGIQPHFIVQLVVARLRREAKYEK